MVEIAWKSDGRATCRPGSGPGPSLAIGPAEQWLPADLLAAAVGASVMETFLASADAARVTVLGYAASAALVVPLAGRPVIDVHLRIVVAPGVAPGVIGALSRHARRTAPLTRLLAPSVTVASDVAVETAVPA